MASLLAFSTCTPLREHSEQTVHIEVEADEEIQQLADEVSVVVETLAAAQAGWVPDTTRRFTPSPGGDWPVRLQLERRDTRIVYNVLAIARDARRSVVAQARLIADPAERLTERLRLRFDRECLAQAEPCEATATCALGECVDARLPLPTRTSGAGAPRADAGAAQQGVAGAALEQTCSADGAQACDGHASRTPLVCRDRRWQAAAQCAEDERCDSAPGPTQGQCRMIASECRNRLPGVSFCDADGTMRACTDLVSAQVLQCGNNEGCIDGEDGVRCACRAGFVDRGAGCKPGTDCEQDRGGCDALTECRMVDDKPSCSACPAGHEGDGRSGCVPQLLSLQLAEARLEPAFAPDIHVYTARVPLRVQRVSLKTEAPSTARVAVDAVEVSASWTSGVLPLGKSTLLLSVTSRAGRRGDYRLELQRSAQPELYLKADTGSSGDLFATSMAANGGVIVVGAPYDDGCANGQASNECANSGAAFVFERSGAGFRQVARLKASDPHQDAFFGTSVGIVEDTIAVGALGYDIFNPVATPRAGAVYVFRRGAAGWGFSQQLTPESGSAAGAAFGLQLCLAPETLVVGAPLADARPGVTHSGVVHVFSARDGQWQRVQQLQSDPPSPEARFGSALALSDDLLAIGAPQQGDPAARAGAVYLFERSSGTYRSKQSLRAPNPQMNDQFGYALGLSGDVLAVGAPHNAFDVSNPSPGAVYVFAREAGGLRTASRLEATQPRAADFFGTSLALARDALLIGASGDESAGSGVGADAAASGLTFSGAAYLFARTDQGFERSTYLKASHPDARDGFGTSVALTDEELVVGANLEDAAARGGESNADDDSQSDTGAAFVYR